MLELSTLPRFLMVVSNQKNDLEDVSMQPQVFTVNHP